MPLIFISLMPLRRSGVWCAASDFHCAYDIGKIAYGLLAAGTPWASCSWLNVDRWPESQFASIVAPFRIFELKNEYVPDDVCGANFWIGNDPVGCAFASAGFTCF